MSKLIETNIELSKDLLSSDFDLAMIEFCRRWEEAFSLLHPDMRVQWVNQLDCETNPTGSNGYARIRLPLPQQ